MTRPPLVSRLFLALLTLTFGLLPGCGWSDVRTPKTAAAETATPPAAPTKYLQTDVTTIDGKKQSLEDYKGDVILVVNTASKCGLTGQYEGLQKLHETYASQGLRVLGFPSNDFGSQEPGSEEEIQAFCSKRYQVTFPLFAKVNANSAPLHPLYEKLTKKSPEGIQGRIKWNFTKFLLGRDGKVIARFEPAVDPLDDQVVSRIKAALEGTKAP
jgi:glutathione peroxidase